MNVIYPRFTRWFKSESITLPTLLLFQVAVRRPVQHHVKHQSSYFIVCSLESCPFSPRFYRPAAAAAAAAAAVEGTESQAGWLAPVVETMPSGHEEHPICQEAAMAREAMTMTVSWALLSL